MPHAHQHFVTLARLTVLITIFLCISLFMGQQAYAAQNKVEVCHSPPGNPTNTQIINVGPNAAATHIEQHGDFLLEGAIERCDAIDNTCDGNVDEGFNLGAFCEQGQGACYATGSTVCAPDQTSLPVCNATIIDAPGLNCDLGATYDGDCDGTPDIEQAACTGLAVIEFCTDTAPFTIRKNIAEESFFEGFIVIAMQTQDPLVNSVLQSPVCENLDSACGKALRGPLFAIMDLAMEEQVSALEEQLTFARSIATQEFADFLASNTTNLNEKVGAFGSAGDGPAAVAALSDIFAAVIKLPFFSFVSDTAQNVLESCHADFQNQLAGFAQCLVSCQPGDTVCRSDCADTLNTIDSEYMNCKTSIISNIQACTFTQ